MDMLNSVVEFYIENKYPTYEKDIKKALEKQLIGDIRIEAIKNMTEEEEKERIEKIKKVEKEARERLWKSRRVQLVVEAVFLAFFIGMLVNQFTNKSGYSWGWIIVFMIVVVVFMFLLTEIKFGNDYESKE